MKGICLAASLVATFAFLGGASANDQRPTDPEYRLLVLDGTLVRWALPTGHHLTVVKYAFLTQPAEFKGARNCGKMLPAAAALDPSHVDQSAFRHEVRAAFDMWEAAANISFRETKDVAEAGILIGAEAEPRGRAFTNVAPHGTVGTGISGISQSLICLNPETRWKIGFDGNLDVYDLRYTIAHEIGHAIGLDHPGAEGQLMSYRYVERSRSLQPGDIAGAAALYGHPRQPATSIANAGRLSPSSDLTPSDGARFGLGDAGSHRNGAKR